MLTKFLLLVLAFSVCQYVLAHPVDMLQIMRQRHANVQYQIKWFTTVLFNFYILGVYFFIKRQAFLRNFTVVMRTVSSLSKKLFFSPNHNFSKLDFSFHFCCHLLVCFVMSDCHQPLRVLRCHALWHLRKHSLSTHFDSAVRGIDAIQCSGRCSEINQPPRKTYQFYTRNAPKRLDQVHASHVLERFRNYSHSLCIEALDVT